MVAGSCLPRACRSTGPNRWRRCSRGQSVRCPALVLHRPDASGTPLAAAEALAAALPNSRLELLAGTSSHLFGEYPDEVVQRIVEFVEDPSAQQGSRPRGRGASAAASGLSPRETEVLRCLAAGDTNAEIARRLGLSVNTVERHVTNLYRKIDARSRSDAIAFAIRMGMV